MASSANHNLYVCDGEDNDCHGVANNGSSGNTTSIIMSEMSIAMAKCYSGEVSLYKELHDVKLRERAKNRCSESVASAIQSMIKHDPRLKSEYENLTNLSKTGLDSFF